MNLNYIPSPKLFSVFILGISAFSLVAAFIAQYGFDLRPCYLCLLQRIPFAANVALGLIGFLAPVERYRRRAIGAAGLLFLINSGIALYHSGVERKWWEGISGCSTPNMSGSIEDLLERIKNTDVVRCDEIPWELFGLSMANYNVAMCFGLGFLCFVYLFATKIQKQQ